jgi:hypothetical protein
MVRWVRSFLLLPVSCVVLAGCAPRVNPVDFAPDGRRIVVSAGEENRLVVTGLDGSAARELPGTESARGPRWSSDGRRIAFLDADGLALYEVEKEAVAQRVEEVAAVGSWSPRGDELVAFRKSEAGLQACWLRLPELRETAKVLLPVSEVDQDRGVRWLEKRDGIAFMGGGSERPYEVYTVEGDVAYRITNSGDVIGFGLDARGERLLWARLAPQAVGTGVTFWSYDLTNRSVTRLPYSARFAFTAEQRRTRTSPVQYVQFSPDGRYVALGVNEPSGGMGIYLSRLDGSEVRLLEQVAAPTPAAPKRKQRWNLLAPYWAPGSERLAVVKTGTDSAIRVYDVAGGAGRKLSVPNSWTKE